MKYLSAINSVIKYLLGTFIFVFFIGYASAQRNWLSNSATKSQLASYLTSIDHWRTTEKISLLQQFNDLPDAIKLTLIHNGEKYLSFHWPNLPATVFLQFAENGNRSHYESMVGKRKEALSALVIAELAEQKGRFIPQVVNGVWAICEESTWEWPAHLYIQRQYTPLPNPGENIVDLGDAETAGLISWTYFLLKDRLDSVTKIIPERMVYELEKRVIQPYLKRDDFWWMGFHGQRVNNWNPWCNGDVLLTTLLVEKNNNRLDSAVYKTMHSVDHFIDQYPDDGGCDEGPSYWSVAGGSLIMYLQLLKSATHGKIDITNHPLIEKMGEYIYKMNIAGNEFVDYGDAHPTTTPNFPAIFEFGKACHNDTLKQFAAYFAKRGGNAAQEFIRLENNLQAFVNYLQIFPEIKNSNPVEPLLKLAWFPDLQVLTTRSHAGSVKGLFLSAKGGTNGESHNHNDVGNFIIYVNGKPAIIDIGVGTYTRETFSKNRYKIFTMQSAWHNLPTINGVMQHAGGRYKAENVKLYSDNRGTHLSMNIDGVYPKEADVKSWKRLLSFNGEEVTLQEKYELTAYKQPFTLSLITPLNVSVKDNFIILKNVHSGYGLKIRFNPKKFQVKVENKQLKDPKLIHAWSDSLNRILLIDEENKLKGNYEVDFSTL